MANHRITVLIGGGSTLANTEANRQRVLIFSGTNPIGASTGNIGGNIGARVPPLGQYHFDLNHPRVPGAIAVSGYSPQRYDDADLSGQPSLVNQLATAIERGLVQIVDESSEVDNDGTAASMAAASGGLITITGLASMADPASVGNYLFISGADTPENNGAFRIVAVNSATSVDVAAGSAPGADANNGSIVWDEQGASLDRADLTSLL